MALSTSYKIGFIGLGAMGTPMAQNLAKSLPEGDRVCIFDVSQAVMDDLQSTDPDRYFKATDAKQIAELNVCMSLHTRLSPQLQALTTQMIGHRDLDGS